MNFSLRNSVKTLSAPQWLKIESVKLFVCVMLLSGLSLHAQVTPGGEKLVPLTVNPIQTAEAIRHANDRTSVFIQDTITLPTAGITDDFSYASHRPDSSLWDL